MQPTINSLITATRKATKFLQRDFFELEMLQNSSRGTQEFCTNSYLRTKNFLKEELQKHYQFLFFADEKYSVNDEATIMVFVNPIEGIQNLGKSIPFFAITVTYLKKIQQEFVPTFSIINFPVLNEVYYAEKGGGVWSEADSRTSSKVTRLRVSGCSNIEQAMVATNDTTAGLKISQNVRCFGSECYNLIMFATGKCDIFYSTTTDYALKAAFSLIIRESGGMLIPTKCGMLSSNNHLIEKIKPLIT
jgi:myo-inositol-1(or 4)-monophosphatase